ncbi:MAG: 5-formyltetrahydrofolate cyclo-ligase [Microbacterium sp.]
MTDAPDDAKRALRAEIRERRQQRSDAQREADAIDIAAQLDTLVQRFSATSLACYLSAPTEPGTRPFLNSGIERGLRILLPVTRADGLLDWTVADPDGGEFVGDYGVPEAKGEVLGPIAVNDVDLLIVPAAAVDRRGVRLGWGRGFYDKTLGSMVNCPPVYAVIYDSELVESVPQEVHDQPVTGIVTPTRIVNLPN